MRMHRPFFLPVSAFFRHDPVLMYVTFCSIKSYCFNVWFSSSILLRIRSSFCFLRRRFYRSFESMLAESFLTSCSKSSIYLSPSRLLVEDLSTVSDCSTSFILSYFSLFSLNKRSISFLFSSIF